MQVKSTVKLNMAKIHKLTQASVTALERTAEALHTEVVQAQVMPFETGHLQEDATFVDYSESSQGKVSLVTSTPYARRLYYHPEYNFQTDENPFAGGEWYAMDAGGWAKAAMTGKKLGFSFKGKRSVGDPGNDYIAGLAWKFGEDVMTKFEWEMVSGAKLSCEVVVNVTTPGGGDTTNIDTLEFEVVCYGAPVFTPAGGA